MHELLQHFEEHHVEDEGDEMEEDHDGLQFQFEGGQMDMDTMMMDDSEHQAPFSTGMYHLGTGGVQSSSRLRNQSNQSLSEWNQQVSEGGNGVGQFDSQWNRNQPIVHNPWQVIDTPPQILVSVPEIEIDSFDGPDNSVIYDEETITESAVFTSPGPSLAASTPTPKLKKVIATDQDGKHIKGDRPYKCKVDDCEKAYKNPGGLKYHMHHGHCEDTGDPVMNDIIHKPYQCSVEDCGKRYKNLNGLKVF